MLQSHCKCTQSKVNPVKVSWWSTFLIVILPKCPFCIMAYSSAITMCGGPAMYVSENNWVSYMPIALALVVVLMIALKFRDFRTYFALAFSLMGTLLVILTHQTIIEAIFYYLGTALLIFGIWTNGSLFSILGIKSSKRSVIKV